MDMWKQLYLNYFRNIIDIIFLYKIKVYEHMRMCMYMFHNCHDIFIGIFAWHSSRNTIYNHSWSGERPSSMSDRVTS